MSITEHKTTQLVPLLRETWAIQVTNTFLFAGYFKFRIVFNTALYKYDLIYCEIWDTVLLWL